MYRYIWLRSECHNHRLNDESADGNLFYSWERPKFSDMTEKKRSSMWRELNLILHIFSVHQKINKTCKIVAFFHTNTVLVCNFFFFYLLTFYKAYTQKTKSLSKFTARWRRSIQLQMTRKKCILFTQFTCWNDGLRCASSRRFFFHVFHCLARW